MAKEELNVEELKLLVGIYPESKYYLSRLIAALEKEKRERS